MKTQNSNELKVLIFGHTFSNGSAGITMQTLFSNWRKEQLYCASPGDEEMAKYFTSFYRIGNKEIKSRFPFSLFYKYKVESKTINNYSQCNHNKQESQISKKRYLYETIVNPILKLLKVYPFRLKYQLSNDLIQWTKSINPDIIYMVVGSLDDCKLLNNILNFIPNVRSVAHFYDDWINVAPSKTFIPHIYKRKLDQELNILFSKVSVCFSISKYMSEEYNKRYGRSFTPFHNPIDILRYNNKLQKASTRKIKIITYLGRVDNDNYDVINDVIKAVNELYNEGIKYRIKIYTNLNTKESFINKKIHKSLNIDIMPFIAHEKIPNLLMNESDVLLLPNSFSKKSNIYTKYSISTKLTEYLASKTPILVYAPKDIAISNFCSDNKCAKLINRRNKLLLKSSLVELYNNSMVEMVERGYNIAIKNFTTDIVCAKFDHLLTWEK